MEPLSRRNLLVASAIVGGTAAAAHAQSAVFGNRGGPAEGRINSTPKAFSNAGTQNSALAAQMAFFQDPPAADVNGMDLFWGSFNIAHNRVQAGGWAREVTYRPLSPSSTRSRA
jgi:oxalate decarboxylase